MVDGSPGVYGTVLADAERHLDDVEDALGRLEEGTYGVCDQCGEPIDPSRLAELPLARSCGAHPALTDGPSRDAAEPGATA